MSLKTPRKSPSARERYAEVVMLASAEIALVCAMVLLFLLYSYGKDLFFALFVVGLTLVGSIFIRRSLQIAQIVLFISVLLIEMMVLLNAPPALPFVDFVGSEILLPIFVVFDVALVIYFIRSAGTAGETLA